MFKIQKSYVFIFKSFFFSFQYELDIVTYFISLPLEVRVVWASLAAVYTHVVVV